MRTFSDCPDCGRIIDTDKDRFILVDDEKICDICSSKYPYEKKYDLTMMNTPNILIKNVEIYLNLFDPVKINIALGDVHLHSHQKFELSFPEFPLTKRLNKRINRINKVIIELDKFDKDGTRNSEFSEFFEQDKETKEWYYNGFIRYQFKYLLELYNTIKKFTKKEYYEWIYKTVNFEE